MYLLSSGGGSTVFVLQGEKEEPVIRPSADRKKQVSCGVASFPCLYYYCATHRQQLFQWPWLGSLVYGYILQNGVIGVANIFVIFHHELALGESSKSLTLTKLLKFSSIYLLYFQTMGFVSSV